MTRANKFMEEDVLMTMLRDIILKEDREALAELESIINDKEKLSEKVSPIIEDRIDFLKNNFPEEYNAVVNKIVEEKVEQRLATFKDEVLDHITPSLGKMISKYVTMQIQVLKDKIDASVKSTFSTAGIKQKIKAIFMGVNESELVISKIITASIEEVHVIQRNSGLLIASASTNPTIDKDVIAGMLTAIKSFVEDAFQRGNENLEMIQYGSYKLFIQTFHSFYVVVVLDGALSSSEQERLAVKINSFAEQHLKNVNNITEEITLEISSNLNDDFIAIHKNK